jgi:hypothetical protein
MLSLTSLLVLALGACGDSKPEGDGGSGGEGRSSASVTASPDPGGDADPDVDSDTDADTDTDSDTGTAAGTTVPSGSITSTCVINANPLRYDCTVTADPPQAVTIATKRTDGLGPTRYFTSDLVASEHTIQVIYLAPETEYAMDATFAAQPGGPLAANVVTSGTPPTDVGSWIEGEGASTVGLIGTENPCDSNAKAVIYDGETGSLVWYQQLDFGGALGILDMVRFTDEGTIIGETNGSIVEVDIYGNDLARFDVSYPGCCSLNHDIMKWDGNYYSQYQRIEDGLTLDNIVVIDMLGVEQYQWEPELFLPIPEGAFGDFLHTNTEWVDDNGDLHLSWLNQNSVGKFVGDRDAPDWGERIWIIQGGESELGNDIALDWSLVGGADGFGLQHNFHGTRDGRYMLLDNANGRALVISVDEATMTGTVDAAYETNENACGAQGTAMDLWNGNAIVACSTAFLREYDGATGDLVWQGEVECRNGGGGGLFGGIVPARWYPLDGWHEDSVTR